MTDDRRPVVVLLCGLAGSGKTTYARELEARGYVRLSVDEEIWQRFGRHGVDYAAADYDALTAIARNAVDERLVALVGQGHDVVLDSSLWQRARREELKRLVEGAGGQWRLIHLRVPDDVLRERLRERSRRVDANSPFPVTDELLDRFRAGFEVPDGEGEEVVDG